MLFGSSARHVLCEKQGKINEAYKKLQDGWLSNGDKVPPAEFAKVTNPNLASSSFEPFGMCTLQLQIPFSTPQSSLIYRDLLKL